MKTNPNFPAPPANETDEGAHEIAPDTDGFDPYRFGPIHYSAQFFRKLVSTPLPEVPSEDLWKTMPPEAQGGARPEPGGPSSAKPEVEPSEAVTTSSEEGGSEAPRESGERPRSSRAPEKPKKRRGSAPAADLHGAATVIVTPRDETQPARGRLSPTEVERLKSPEGSTPAWLPSVVVALSALVFAAVFWMWNGRQGVSPGVQPARGDAATSGAAAPVARAARGVTAEEVSPAGHAAPAQTAASPTTAKTTENARTAGNAPAAPTGPAPTKSPGRAPAAAAQPAAVEAPPPQAPAPARETPSPRPKSEDSSDGFDTFLPPER